jgi:hypothetical protein
MITLLKGSKLKDEHELLTLISKTNVEVQV